jgi:sugar/nucleoside kinase (ribokinase family)
MRYDVSIIGLYILDVLGRPVTRIPDRGNVEFIDQIRLTVAGTAGGTVVDAAKLGLKCRAVGAVGDDEKADFVIATLEKFGIDASSMQRLKGIPTSATILNVRPNGDRPALHVRGASDHFDVAPATYDQVFDAPIVHLGGTGLLKRLDGEPSRNLLQEAKDMSGQGTPEDCARFYLDQGATCCVFTLGAEGAFYAHKDGTRLQVPAYDITVVDTTGCGDAFDAGFITALHRKMDPEQSVRFAQAAAALVATGLGSDAGIVSFDETLEQMKRWGVKS